MLTKQSININFAKGLDTKSDPYQVPAGSFLSLENSIFSKGGLLQKRNGFGALTSLPNTSYEHITTFNGNLTAIGSNLSAYASGPQEWINTGAIQPMDLSVQPVVRSNTNQTQCDSVVSANNLVCSVFIDNNGSTAVAKYVITDYVTNQIVAPATVIVPISGTIIDSPRVYLLGNYFIVVFGVLISGVNHLEYLPISTYTPTVPGAAVNVSSQYSPSTTLPFDGVVVNNNLYLAWNGNDAGGAIRMQRLTSSLSLLSSSIVGPGSTGNTASYVSMYVDSSTPLPTIWVYYYSAASGGFAFAVDTNIATVLTSTVVNASAAGIGNIACTALNGTLTVFYEIVAQYAYNTAIPTDYVKTNTLTSGGTLGTAKTLVRSVGLASKAFLVNNVPYFLSVYASGYQPSYFLINGSTGGVVSKLAYSNGSANLSTSGGYLLTGLPSAMVQSDGITVDIAYLYKDLVVSANSSALAATTAVTPGGIATQISSSQTIYAQTGVNLATMSLSNQGVLEAEIGSNLNITGGLTWSYDGTVPVEQNFNVWPDYVGATGFTGAPGNMPAQQYYYQALYEWTDAQGNIFRSAPSIPTPILTTAVTFTTGAFLSTDVNTSTSKVAFPTTGDLTGMAVTLTTSGTLPTPLLAATTYYLIIDDSTHIQFASSLANALAGTFIPLTAQGSGTNTLHIVAGQAESVILNIPTLRLTYKTANPVKIVVYRWSTAQQNYYQATSITSPLLNDPTVDYVTFTDTQADTAIVGNSLIYTTGGVVEDIGPPASSTMTLFDDRLWLVDAEDRNLMWFSKQVIQGTPVEMSDLFTVYVAPTISAQGSTGPITALSAMDDKLIIFKEDAIYYINGTGPDNTGSNNGYSQPIFVTSNVGCANQNSIVFMPSGLMFQSDKGIWLLGRDLSTQYIGAAVEAYNSALVESSLAVPGTNQVRFTLNSGITLMYDYFFQQWGTFVGIPALSSTLYQGLHTFINAEGQVLQETPNLYLDGGNPVLMQFTTSWLKLDQLQSYQRAYFFYILGTFITPHFLQMSVAYDYVSTSSGQPIPSQTTLITPNNYSAPYGTPPSEDPYGQGNPYGGPNTIEQYRVFLSQQRCQAVAIGMQEVYNSTPGVVPGAGLTVSGINLVAGFKKSFRPISSAKSFGGGGKAH